MSRRIVGDENNNILWGTPGNNSIFGVGGNNILIGGRGKDTFIGGPGKNTYLFHSLKDSLIGSPGIDRIRDLKIGRDVIGGPRPVSAAKVIQIGPIAALTTSNLKRVLNRSRFSANIAAIFTAGKSTYLAINNGKAGFQPKGTGLINITGYSGKLSQLSIAGPSSYAERDQQYFILNDKALLVSESSKFVRVNVGRTGNALTREILEYTVIGDSAIEGEDFIAPKLNGITGTGQVVFKPGQLQATIKIPLINDDKPEEVKTLGVGLQRSTNGSLSFPRTVNINIIDDDNTSQIGFLSTNIQVSENQKSIAITIIRRGDNSSVSTVDFKTLDGTAIADLDYKEKIGTITFNPGETQHTILIDIIDDLLNEPTKKFTLSLLNPSESVEVFNSQVEISILDDDQPLISSLVRTNYSPVPEVVDFDWTADGKYLFAAQKRGVVRLIENGIERDQPLLDIQDIVNNVRDRGLIGIAVHPDFYNTPYIYIGYTYDPPETQFLKGIGARDGLGNRPSQVAKVRVNLDTFVADLDSFEVILGRNSKVPFFNPSADSTGNTSIPASGVYDENSLIPGYTYDKGFQDNDPDRPGIQNYNIRDFMATDSYTHSVGAIRFGPDGYLYVANGDGTSFNFPDRRSVRVQDPANLSGKILRIDPLTGEGLSTNPFFDGDPNSNSSKVFYYGLRNPFRFAFDPVTGWPVLGDVGWNTAEEVNTGPLGSNFGWPYYEGFQRAPRYNTLPEALRFYQNGNINADSPHQQASLLPLISPPRTEVQAVVMGDFYDRDTFFYANITSHTFYAATLNDDRSLKQITPIGSGPRSTVVMRKGPDNLIYASDRARIYRWIPNVDTVDLA